MSAKRTAGTEPRGAVDADEGRTGRGVSERESNRECEADSRSEYDGKADGPQEVRRQPAVGQGRTEIRGKAPDGTTGEARSRIVGRVRRRGRRPAGSAGAARRTGGGHGLAPRADVLAVAGSRAARWVCPGPRADSGGRVGLEHRRRVGAVQQSEPAARAATAPRAPSRLVASRPRRRPTAIAPTTTSAGQRRGRGRRGCAPGHHRCSSGGGRDRDQHASTMGGRWSAASRAPGGR